MLISTLPRPVRLPAADLYQHFLEGEAGATADHLAYLDRGIDQSPLHDQVPEYPSRLAHTTPPAGHGDPAYPALGQMPAIDESALDFLDSDITNACVCVGSWEEGSLHARWLGRKAADPVQMWSSTKMLPMTHVAVKAEVASPGTVLESCLVQGNGKSISLPAAYDAIVSYRQGPEMSNSLARTLKNFDTPQELEGWLHATTGNQASVFRGGYGAPAYIAQPSLNDQSTHHTVLRPSGVEHHGDNFVSAYDLCRCVSLIGWHSHLGSQAQLAGIKQGEIDTLVRGMGTDSARFVDVSLDALGLSGRIKDPVVISKLGFGLSDVRLMYESVYTAFVQFTDAQTGHPYQVALCLRGARPPHEEDALKLDARMATQVALILQRVVGLDSGPPKSPRC